MFNTPWRRYKFDSIPRWKRNIHVKMFIAGKVDDEDEFNPRLYCPTGWEPPRFMKNMCTERRLNIFRNELQRRVFVQRATPNMTFAQRRTLRALRRDQRLLVVQCDKNLGPAVIERVRYIRMAVSDHLSKNDTYGRLSREEALIRSNTIKSEFLEWFEKWEELLTKHEKNFFKQRYFSLPPHAAINTFYILMKVHKTPLSTRPVVSYSGSLLHGLGVWVDDKLQIAARSVNTYFKSSNVLKRHLEMMTFDDNTKLFTADAVAMYPSIPIEKGLEVVESYLTKYHKDDVPVEAVMDALKLLMRNNIFKFGDAHFIQRIGTAIGAPPAPPWATIYCAENENKLIEKYSNNLVFFKRFIDDVIAAWRSTGSDADRTAWNNFVADLNDPDLELRWIVEKPSMSVDFMDLTITLSQGRAFMSLYEKPNNLHLYIPPNSSHPPGLLTGMVYGMVHRITTLCSSPSDRERRIKDCFRHLRARGYSKDVLKPHFEGAMERARNYQPLTEEEIQAKKKDKNKLKDAVFFHTQFHPNNIPSRELQHLWHTHVVDPDPGYTMPLWDMWNYNNVRCRLRRMIVAYHRPPNLGNILSSRNIETATGPNVSSFLD